MARRAAERGVTPQETLGRRGARPAGVRSPALPGWTLPLPDDVWRVMARDFRLSRREGEVVRHLLDNLDVNDIAARCTLSTRTVRAHLEHVYKKLVLRSKTDLILLVLARVLADSVRE